LEILKIEGLFFYEIKVDFTPVNFHHFIELFILFLNSFLSTDVSWVFKVNLRGFLANLHASVSLGDALLLVLTLFHHIFLKLLFHRLVQQPKDNHHLAQDGRGRPK